MHTGNSAWVVKLFSIKGRQGRWGCQIQQKFWLFDEVLDVGL
jgi:hypothetical protein